MDLNKQNKIKDLENKKRLRRLVIVCIIASSIMALISAFANYGSETINVILSITFFVLFILSLIQFENLKEDIAKLKKSERGSKK